MNDPRRSPSIFTRGAVDLSALRGSQTSAESSATSAQATSPSGAVQPGQSAAAGSTVVIDVTEATFQAEVLERSLHTPVFVDFWASWCEPCKQLSPVLERLAVEAAGAWVLAKVDVDANPRLAQMFRVQGIPLVYAIAGGQPIDAFNGVVPESQLRQWLDAVCKTAGNGDVADVAAPEDPQLTIADDALAVGDLDVAEAAYKKILAESPADAVAEAGLAQVGLLRRTEGVDPEQVLAAAAAAPSGVAAQTLAADVEMITGQAVVAYGRLVEVVRRSRGEDRERARRHLLSLFTIAGPDDPAVAAARRALANALF
ncbi:MAG: tetratricopeptide repeat protein [Dactylosporangium sp.]|nr:tetratricopeptide repeat protein [Dactylosporangium sp.]NNJ61167.1 tetratricopeptide repeat protein [Dactylosporangium sp.]